jgi:hypothetical protein
MTVPAAIREQVRQRAGFCCEFCGVTETDTGGPLTVDHFQPKTKGGTDDLDNLIYCCFRCNQYKHDYWPSAAHEPQLWNPRRERASQHFIELDNGYVHAVTAAGDFTIRQLRLNRSGPGSSESFEVRASNSFCAAIFGSRARGWHRVCDTDRRANSNFRRTAMKPFLSVQRKSSYGQQWTPRLPQRPQIKLLLNG